MALAAATQFICSFSQSKVNIIMVDVRTVIKINTIDIKQTVALKKIHKNRHYLNLETLSRLNKFHKAQGRYI